MIVDNLRNKMELAVDKKDRKILVCVIMKHPII